MSASLSPSPPPAPIDVWLREARAGSPSALGRALEAGRKYLLQVANRNLDDRLKAKIGASDLVQDTYVEAQRNFGQFRGETEAEFYGWLLGILTHRLANNVRHFRHTKSRSVDRELPQGEVPGALDRLQDEAATPAAETLAREEKRMVELALAQMDEPLRSVLIERTWHGAQFDDIGVRHNCSPDAARRLWLRAVKQMRELLAQLK